MVSFSYNLPNAGTQPKHILSSSDISYGQLCQVLDLAQAMKRQRLENPQPIAQVENRMLAMLFEKQSLRTRITFETAIHELGGHGIYLTKSDIDMGQRESVYDVAKNLSQWSAMIVARLNSHTTLCQLAEHSSVPVINALTDMEHPCQALADVLTITEKFGDDALKVAWIGDGNNVANSFAVTASKLGHNVVICTPPGYEAASYVYSQPNVEHCYDPKAAAQDADVVYTDVWVSMGQESEEQERIERFAKYQVNDAIMALTKPNAIFLHCLPAKRGFEVVDSVIDGPKSVVFEQANNRLYAQKALMHLLLENRIA
jgi:ornithine carbamoyltransferase